MRAFLKKIYIYICDERGIFHVGGGCKLCIKGIWDDDDDDEKSV